MGFIWDVMRLSSLELDLYGISMKFSELACFLTCFNRVCFTEHGAIELATCVNINQRCKLRGTTSQGGLETSRAGSMADGPCRLKPRHCEFRPGNFKRKTWPDLIWWIFFRSLHSSAIKNTWKLRGKHHQFQKGHPIVILPGDDKSQPQ